MVVNEWVVYKWTITFRTSAEPWIFFRMTRALRWWNLGLGGRRRCREDDGLAIPTKKRKSVILELFVSESYGVYRSVSEILWRWNPMILRSHCTSGRWCTCTRVRRSYRRIKTWLTSCGSSMCSFCLPLRKSRNCYNCCFLCHYCYAHFAVAVLTTFMRLFSLWPR